MARILGERDVWKEIRSRAKASGSLTGLVGYLGRRPDTLLRWPARSSLIVNLSEAAVRQGASSARGALRLLRKRVAISSLRALHGKVYLFDRSAIVCSANLSEQSANELIEVGVLLTRPAEVAAVKTLIRLLSRDAVSLDAKMLRALAKHEPRGDRHGRRVGFRRRGPRFMNGRPVWVVPCVPDASESPRERQDKARKARAIARDLDIASAREIEWMNACGRSVYTRVKDADWVFFLWDKSARSPLGALDGPYEVLLGGVDLGRRFGDRRYCLPMAPHGRRRVIVRPRTLPYLSAALGLTLRRDNLWHKVDQFALRNVARERATHLAKALRRPSK